MEPIVKWRNDEYCLNAEVFPYGSEGDNWRTSIDVRRYNWGSGWRDAEVNWPAIGAQNTSITKEFAIGLLRAAALAEYMNGPVAMYKVVLDVKLASDGEEHTFERLIAANELGQVLASIREGVDSDGNVTRIGTVERVIEEEVDVENEAES